MRKTENQTNIYDASGHYIASQPYPLEMWLSDPEMYYAEYQPGYIGTDILYDNPVMENGTLREMTLEETITNGLRVLGPGEIYDPITQTIQNIPAPKDFLKPEWDYNAHIWLEKATEQDKRDYLSPLVYKWKDEISDEGFDFMKADGTTHHQLFREKDATRISEALSFMDKQKELGMGVVPIYWQFSETDIVPMQHSDMTSLFIAAGVFRKVVYEMMAKWRAKEHIDLSTDTKENFAKDIHQAYKAGIEDMNSKF